MSGSLKLTIARQRSICVITDWITSFLAFFSFNIFRFYFFKQGDGLDDLLGYVFSAKLSLEDIFIPTLLLGVYWISGYYNNPLERSRLNEFLNTLFSQIFNALVIYLGALTNDQLYLRRENWILLLILFLLLFVFTYIGRICVTASLLQRRRRYGEAYRTVIVGLSKEAKDVARKLTSARNMQRARVIAFFPFGNEKESVNEQDEFSDIQRLDSIDALKNLCKENKVDQIIIVPTAGKTPTNKILYLLYNLFEYDVSIKINPDIMSLITPTIRLEDILGEPFIDLTTPQISEFSKNIKRAIDVVFSFTGLLLLSPFLGVVALAVKRSGKGGIIYSQERIGIHRKPFRIYKFRSMVPDAEKDGIPLLSKDEDARVTKVGKWMRKYRIDELPQLWNVLKGDMTLVGPRPEREFFIEKLVKKAPWYSLVFQVKPGVTSWGMVKYGYASDIDQMIERNRFDLIYLTNMSIAVDFKILIHTIKTVGSGEGK